MIFHLMKSSETPVFKSRFMLVILQKTILCAVLLCVCAGFLSLLSVYIVDYLDFSGFSSRLVQDFSGQNDTIGLALQVPTWHSSSELFVLLGVPTCQALLGYINIFA